MELDIVRGRTYLKKSIQRPEDGWSD